MNKKFRRMIKRVGMYPPFLGMGIKIRHFSDDFRRFEVELRERWYTRNLFGTHFGGSLYAMSDPFFVFIITLNLGRDYIVWDKAACIEFLKPGKGTILGVYEISEQRLSEIRAQVDEHGKQTFQFEVDLVDEAGEAVAHVKKDVYVRRKSREKAA